MGKKLLALFISLATVSVFAQSRPGSLRGTVYDDGTGQPMPFANVVIKNDAGETISGTQTDFEGAYNLNPVDPGNWTVEVSSIGYQTAVRTGVLVSPGNATYLNFRLKEASEMLGEVVIEAYKPPLIEKGKTASVVTQEDIQNMAVRDVTSVASQTAGVTTDANGNTRVRGTREEGTVYFIDGVKVRGNTNIPQAAIQQTEVITGGLPAQYGDAIGGVINTTTRGPSGTFFGNVEYLTSVPFDDYDYNLLALTVGGPIYKRKTGNSTRTIVGFLAAVEYQYEVEPSPTAVPYISVDRDLLIDIEENPLVVDPSGNSVNPRTLYVTEDQLSDINARPNSWNNQLRANGTIQIATSKSTSLNLGGRFYYNDDKRASYVDHIFNYDNNLDAFGLEWAAFARFQQRFTATEEEAKTSLIKNAYYTIQADYSRDFDRIEDGRFGDNFFQYGYVGQFDINTSPVYIYGQDEQTGAFGYRFVGNFESGIDFTEGGYNRVRENYTRQYFELAQETPTLPTRTLNELLGAGVPINGRNPASVYSLWGNAGSLQSFAANGVDANYWKRMNSQFRVTGSSSFDIKDHSIIVGFEYEQRSDRSWAVNADGLWTQMRLLQNRAQSELDLDNPIFVRDENGVYQDTINYNYLYSPGSRSEFGANLRAKLGLDPRGTDQLNIDALDPNIFSIDMFSAEELYNQGGVPYVKYFGYDKNGDLLAGQPSIADFFNEVDENGNRTRPVGAFQPVYIAGYIQDQFAFNDLTFNAGIRVDRYDLNQSVLRDPYVLGDFYQVSDLPNTALSDQQIPAGIGQDFVVYVSDFEYNENTRIVGYRDGTQWYNEQGQPIANPLSIANAAGGQARPFLVNPNDSSQLSPNSFQDYDPQVVVMPRVSFTFPINDNAIFIAHYDILAQRPTTGLSRLDPFQYYDLDNNNSGGILNNPNLRPQKTTEYEIGFKQALTDNSALKISAFYRELRDLIQVQLYAQAYPISYTAFGNQDYATVKGFTFEYDLRRTNNVTINANYTLQFANGTGSGPTSGVNLASAGQPNLRYILPLSYDNRHQFLVRFDYRFGRDTKYSGPTWGRKFLQSFGINITANALSGEPYTRRRFAYSVNSGSASVPVEGQINGSRLPWQTRFDARINKVFFFKNKNAGSLEVYFQIFNLLNTQNILNVYPFTGDPSDDGYLASALAQTAIREQVNAQAFTDLYNRRVNSPFNFSAPRQIRLGIAYNF